MVAELHKFTIILLSITASVTVVYSEQESTTNPTTTIISPSVVTKPEEVTTKSLLTNRTNGSRFGCVPFYKCDRRTRMLKKHDFNVTNISTCSESEKCEGRYDVCCQVSNNQAIINTKLNSDGKERTPLVSYGKVVSETSGVLSEDTNNYCVCVSYYLCNNGFVDSNKDVHVFSRRRRRSEDGTCKNPNDVCCKIDDKTTSFPANWTGCGHRNSNGVGIQPQTSAKVGGDTAKFGELPWMVMILRKVVLHATTFNVYQCGGALIHPQVVITTAFCITDIEPQLKIRAGVWDTQNQVKLRTHQEREVSTITVHSQFNPGPLYNDIALLFLKEPVTIVETVDFICLPPQNAVFQNPTKCLISGWGKDAYGEEGKYQSILKKIELPIVDKDPCQEAMRTTRLGEFFQLHQSFICAGGEGGKDSCKGDGGSPLVCPIAGLENRYVLAGMASWGILCGETNIPGIYTNVALYREWIDQEMANNNFDWKSYQY